MVKTEISKNEAEFGEFVLEVVKTLVALIEEKDPFLRKHSERVANNCANFCEEYKIVGGEDVETIYFAGLLHDIGIVAIPRLGLKETSNIVLAIANKDLYKTENVKFKILMDRLWVYALASGYGSKLIAQALKFDDLEKYFLMGLTHDIGKILLLKAFSEVAKGKSLSVDAIEANLQEAHIGLGSMLLKRWRFDAEYINVITHHEDVEFSPDTVKEILVVHLANMLTRQIGFSLFKEKIDFAELPSAQILKLEPAKVESIGEEVKSIISDVAHLF